MAVNNEQAITRNRKLIMNLCIVVAFAALMIAAISYFYRSEPDYQDKLMHQLGEQLQSAAVTAHWQWQAEGQPQMIMLVQYNQQGKETARSPVRMALAGLPEVKPSSEGCEKLWAALLSRPMMLDGFRVNGEYYQGSLVGRESDNAYCRFRLSRGTYFDYFINKGEVEHEK